MRAVDVRGRYSILRNDAVAAIACFRKGSSQSPQMQRCALRLDRAAAAVEVDCLPYNVPGLTLVAEGIDGASRSGSDFGEGINVDSILDRRLQRVVGHRRGRRRGRRLGAVDAFASASQHPGPGRALLEPVPRAGL